MRVRRVRTWTIITWQSLEQARAYNVFDRHTRISHRSITSRAGMYRFRPHHLFRDLRLVPLK